MTKDIIDIAVKRFAQSASEIYGNQLNSIILYGSCARGDFTKDSDLDIMVLLNVEPEAIPDERQKMYGIANDIDLDLDTVIAATYQSKAVFDKYLPISPFYQNINNEGVKIG